MINRQMETYKLYEVIKSYDKLGIEKEDILYVTDVDVAINFISTNRRTGLINKITEDVIYKDCEYTGLTIYKGLNLAKDYKIVADDIEYLIKSINENTRFSQWILKRVLTNG